MIGRESATGRKQTLAGRRKRCKAEIISLNRSRANAPADNSLSGKSQFRSVESRQVNKPVGKCGAKICPDCKTWSGANGGRMAPAPTDSAAQTPRNLTRRLTRASVAGDQGRFVRLLFLMRDRRSYAKPNKTRCWAQSVGICSFSSLLRVTCAGCVPS